MCLLPIEFKDKRQFGLVPYTGQMVGWAFNQVGSATYEVPMWEEKRRYGNLYQSWDMIGIHLTFPEYSFLHIIKKQQPGSYASLIFRADLGGSRPSENQASSMHAVGIQL